MGNPSDKVENNEGLSLLFICDGLTADEARKRLNALVAQSMRFKEIYCFSNVEFIWKDVFPDGESLITPYLVGKETGDFPSLFSAIIKNSDCGMLLVTDGQDIIETKFSIELFYLQARLSSKPVMRKQIEGLRADKLFKSLGSYIIRRDWLINEDISLSGISVADQIIFISEAIAASGDTANYRNIINSSFLERASNWAMALIDDDYPNAILLCKRLYEVAKKYHCAEIASVAEILSDLLIKLSGLFVSYYGNNDADRSLKEMLINLGDASVACNGSGEETDLRSRIEEAISRPLVSVIVPVYNAENTIYRCLSSIFTQTLKNIEVICVNDGSEDNSLGILEELRSSHSNYTVLTQENMGQATARNKAMEIARGKYIGFVDIDDWIEPDMFEKMALALERHPEAQVAKCGTHCDYDYPVSENEKKTAEAYFSEPESEGVHPVNERSLLTGAPWDKLYRSSIIKENGIKFPEGVKNEDEAFVLFFVCRSSNFVLLKSKLYHYEKTQTGTMNSQAKKAADGVLPDVFHICNLMLDFIISEKKRGYTGRILKTILGAADRFETLVDKEVLEHVVNTLLSKAQYQIYVETIIQEKRAWCIKKASKYVNLYFPEPYKFKDLSLWLPSRAEEKTMCHAKKPLVSFIIPVYNAERYLVHTVESIRQQSLDEIEIIFVNDGSTDGTSSILANYQAIDPRITVFNNTNSGVSVSRDFGIQNAHGKYIAFVDGDDLVAPDLAKKCYEIAEKHSLDVVAFDYECFDCASGKHIDHYWTIANRKGYLPIGQVFDGEAFRNMPFSFYGSCCNYLWKTVFLKEKKLKFPKIRISEDLCFVVEAISEANRVKILPEVFYHYRRNVPGSAITSVRDANFDPRSETIEEFCRLFKRLDGKKLSARAKANIMGRILSEMRFFSTQSETLKDKATRAITDNRNLLLPYFAMLSDAGLRKWTDSICRSAVIEERKHDQTAQPLLPKLPELDKLTSVFWSAIKEKRKTTEHDIILVISFLGSEAADPLDSWTFFSWLQEHNIPSRFVTYAYSEFYKELVERKNTKDVIALRKSCLDDNHSAYFLRKLFDPLCRAKAIVFEDFVWPWPLRAHFKIADWNLIFLQHGVTYFKLFRSSREFFSRFNLVNVSSTVEKELLSDKIGSYEVDGYPCPKYVVAGFPRWDRLSSKSGTPVAKRRVIFIMFTWRKAFQDKSFNIRESSYFNSICSFVKSPIINELKQKEIDVVIAPHHRLLELVPEIIDEWPTELCQQKDIKYWVENASCLVTDFSSIAWDFLFQHKPVVFWALDRLDASMEESSYAYKQVEKISTVVHDPAELYKKLQHYAENGFSMSEEEAKRLGSFFPYRDGFSQRVYEKLCCYDDRKEGED